MASGSFLARIPQKEGPLVASDDESDRKLASWAEASRFFSIDTFPVVQSFLAHSPNDPSGLKIHFREPSNRGRARRVAGGALSLGHVHHAGTEDEGKVGVKRTRDCHDRQGYPEAPEYDPEEGADANAQNHGNDHLPCAGQVPGERSSLDHFDLRKQLVWDLSIH
ncbi:hypothetical protein [Rathayibacter sp. AY1A7]|uniref:hypothetical protein n=1 Tax=Rathayibacter sp. AY1A7 TaxID=2080524 RepID=UPI0011AFD306|nr:hypothetical protein [Rathayibacter sp. AY1A7]